MTVGCGVGRPERRSRPRRASRSSGLPRRPPPGSHPARTAGGASPAASRRGARARRGSRSARSTGPMAGARGPGSWLVPAARQCVLSNLQFSLRYLSTLHKFGSGKRREIIDNGKKGEITDCRYCGVHDPVRDELFLGTWCHDGACSR